MVFTDSLIPADPLLVRLIIAVIVDEAFLGQTVLVVFTHEGANVITESLATLRCSSATN